MAFPVVLGLVVTLVYNLADTFFIARTNDTDLIAGVSLCAPVFTALMAFGNIYGQGGSSLISRLLGRQDGESVRRVSSFCFYIALATGLVLAVLMTAFNRPLLLLLGADEDTLPHAFQYYIVLAVCAPIMVLSFIHSSLVRCEGMSTESMFGTVLDAVINIILDPILISAAGMGAMGAAGATVIGYFCSVLYFLRLLRKKSRCLSVRPSLCRVSGGELRQILGVGVTAALSNLMQSLCVIVLNQFLLPYGNDKISAMGIVLLLTVLFQAMGKVGAAVVLSISRQGLVFVAALLVCVKLFAYDGVLMGQAAADVLSALIALGLLACCNPMGRNFPGKPEL